MIKIESRRESYRDIVEVTLDEDGVEGLTHALTSLPDNRAVRHVEVESDGGPTLRILYESKAAREEREKKEAEDRAKFNAERAEREEREERERKAGPGFVLPSQPPTS